MALTVDASVAVKWFTDEPGFLDARALIATGELFTAPDLLFAEIANVMWKKQRRGQASQAQRLAAAERLPDLVRSVVPLAPLMARAAEMAETLDHSAYDCFYLACAESTRTTLITADEPLIAAASRHGLAHLVTPLHA